MKGLFAILACALVGMLATSTVASLGLPLFGGEPVRIGMDPHGHGLLPDLTPDVQNLDFHAESAVAVPETNPRWTYADGAPVQAKFICPAAEDQPARVLGCPLYVIDPEDIMTEPTLVVDPNEPDWIAFHALHGGRGFWFQPADMPPSNASRYDNLHQPHTLFRNIHAGGKLWTDHRYYSPWKGTTGTAHERIFGEDSSLSMDDAGRLVASSLYSWRDAGEPQFHYEVVVWKQNRINYEPDWNTRLQHIQTSAPYNTVDSLHSVFVPKTRTTVVLWRETGAQESVGIAAGPTSWIAAATSDMSESSSWKMMDAAKAIGPCREISNPVALADGLVYLACLPDAGYTAPGADNRFYQIHAIDTAQGTTKRVAQVPVTRGHPALAHRFGDELLFAAANLEGNTPSVKFVFGNPTMPVWRATSTDFGPQLANQTVQETNPPGLKIRDVRITAMALAPISANIHVIYSESYDRETFTGADINAASIFKSFGVIDPTGSTFLGQADMRVGDQMARARFDVQYQGTTEAIYEDRKDSIVTVVTDTGPREYMALGDYGQIRFAEVVEENALGFGFPAAVAPPPIPTPTPGVDPATIGAVAGALAGAMSLRMLSSRKKQKVEAPSL